MTRVLRSTAFELAYWLITALFALICTALALLPGRRPLGFGLWLYASVMLFAMRWVAGIRIEVRGRERLPERLPERPAVIAAKHQSWSDGFAMLAHVEPLGFVCGDHLERYPLVGRILNKAGAIVLSNNGGEAARERLAKGCASLREDGRSVLIYPEGRLSAPGERHPYRKGVYHLYEASNRPCVPVATNLGLAWDRRSFLKTPGRAVLEFLDPIEPGLDKDAFMDRLETAIETRTNALVSEGLT